MAQPEALPPWDNPDKLPAWRPVVTPALREHRWPTRRRAWHTLRNLKIKSPATNTLIELSLPEWVLEILRGCDGTRPLRAILSEASPPPHHSRLSRELHLLYQLALVNFLPPVTG